MKWVANTFVPSPDPKANPHPSLVISRWQFDDCIWRWESPGLEVKTVLSGSGFQDQWPGQSCPSSLPSNLLAHGSSPGKRTGAVEAFSASASINKHSRGNCKAPSPVPGPLGKLCRFKKEVHWTAKETINKMKRQPMEWEKVFANNVSDKRLISTTYKESIQLNSKTPNWF